MWFLFPDTKGRPLEEVAAIFGDADEVAIYQKDLQIDFEKHTIIERHENNEKLAKTGDQQDGETVEQV